MKLGLNTKPCVHCIGSSLKELFRSQSLLSPLTAWTTPNFVPKVELSHKKLNIAPCTPKIDCPTQLKEFSRGTSVSGCKPFPRTCFGWSGQDMFHMSSTAVRKSAAQSPIPVILRHSLLFTHKTCPGSYILVRGWDNEVQ